MGTKLSQRIIANCRGMAARLALDSALKKCFRSLGRRGRARRLGNAHEELRNAWPPPASEAGSHRLVALAAAQTLLPILRNQSKVRRARHHGFVSCCRAVGAEYLMDYQESRSRPARSAVR